MKILSGTPFEHRTDGLTKENTATEKTQDEA